MGTNCLAKHPLTNTRAKAPLHGQVYAAPEPLLQVLLKAAEGEEPNRSVELDEDVYVALGARLVPGNGSEQRERMNARSRQLGPVSSEDVQNFVSPHAGKSSTRRLRQSRAAAAGAPGVGRWRLDGPVTAGSALAP